LYGGYFAFWGFSPVHRQQAGSSVHYAELQLRAMFRVANPGSMRRVGITK
jgi:hypothetical protein